MQLHDASTRVLRNEQHLWFAIGEFLEERGEVLGGTARLKLDGTWHELTADDGARLTQRYRRK